MLDKEKLEQDLNLNDLIKNKILEDKNKFTERVYETAMEELRSSLSWQFKEEVTAELVEFAKEELRPAIREYFENNKEEVLKAVVNSVAQSMADVGTMMCKRAADNVGNSWRFEKVIKELFGI